MNKIVNIINITIATIAIIACIYVGVSDKKPEYQEVRIQKVSNIEFTNEDKINLVKYLNTAIRECDDHQIEAIKLLNFKLDNAQADVRRNNNKLAKMHNIKANMISKGASENQIDSINAAIFNTKEIIREQLKLQNAYIKLIEFTNIYHTLLTKGEAIADYDNLLMNIHEQTLIMKNCGLSIAALERAIENDRENLTSIGRLFGE